MTVSSWSWPIVLPPLVSSTPMTRKGMFLMRTDWSKLDVDAYTKRVTTAVADVVAEQVKAGIQSLPRGQGMAGTALGLTLPQTYRFVLLPMAFRIILPPLTSDDTVSFMKAITSPIVLWPLKMR